MKVYKKLDCLVYEQPEDSYLAMMLLPKGDDKCIDSNSSIEKEYIQYGNKIDKHGWINPVGEVTEKQLANQTEGLSLYAKNSRNEVIEQIKKEVGINDDYKVTIKKLKEIGLSNKQARLVAKWTQDFMKKKVIATAKVEINGIDKNQLRAYSGRNNPMFSDGWIDIPKSPVFSKVKAKEGNEDVFEIGYGDDIKDFGHNRSWDAEVKIVEQLAQKLGNDFNVEGKVTIFSEKRTCSSCQGQQRIKHTKEGIESYDGVIDQFSKRYPMLEVIVYDGEGRKLILKAGKPLTKH